MSHEQVFMDYDPGRAFARRLYDLQDEASVGRYEEETVDGVKTGRVHWVPGNPKAVPPAEVVHEGDELAAAVAAQFAALEALFWERQRKYGPGNIAEFGDYGILVRLYDKLARLRRYYVEKVGDMPDESVRDAWADVAVYATIALVCMDGQWPGWEPKEGRK